MKFTQPVIEFDQLKSTIVSHNLFDGVSDAVILLDTAFVVHAFNIQAKVLHNTSVVNQMLLAGKNYLDNIAESKKATAAKYLQAALDGNSTTFDVSYGKTPVVWYTTTYRPIRHLTTTTGIIISFHRKRALTKKDHEALCHAELFDSLSEAIISTDINFVLEYANKAAIELYDLTGKSIISQPLRKLLKHYEESNFEQIIKTLETHGTWQSEIKILTKSGVVKFIQSTIKYRENKEGERIGLVFLDTDVSHQKKLHEKLLWQELEMRKKILRTTLQAEEKQRNEIGAELHDNVNQLIVTAMLYMGMMKKAKLYNEETLVSCSTFLSSAIEEIRKISYRLVCPISNSIGLKDSIKDLSKIISETTNLDVNVSTDKFNESKVAADCKQTLFRIIQEQINNIIKYAEASIVDIILFTDAQRLTLTIIDNGKGFDVSKQRRGIGLTNIIHRAEAFYGEATIISSLGMGCQLQVSMPLVDGLDNHISSEEFLQSVA